MPARSKGSLAAVLLTQRLVEAPAAPLKASEYWAVAGRLDDLAALLDGDASAVARAAGVEADLADRIAALVGVAAAVAFALDDHEQSGLTVIAAVDERYPPAVLARLGTKAPPLLYVVGDAALLSRPLLGIVGSRDINPAAGDAARQAATAAVRNELGVVSGGAKGVDQLAMQASLDAGGVAVGVLADSLMRAVRDADIRRAVTDGRLCLCTPYKPTAGFTVANAMARNKLIYALSQTTFVVAADLESGGTWAGATEALRHTTAPVVVWAGDGAGDGNARLVELGGYAVRAVDELFPLPDVHPQPAAMSTNQLAMDV